jgi:type III secretory pathway component EscS
MWKSTQRKNAVTNWCPWWATFNGLPLIAAQSITQLVNTELFPTKKKIIIIIIGLFIFVDFFSHVFLSFPDNLLFRFSRIFDSPLKKNIASSNEILG